MSERAAFDPATMRLVPESVLTQLIAMMPEGDARSCTGRDTFVLLWGALALLTKGAT